MKMIDKYPAWLVCFIAIIVYAIYQALVASDRYVSSSSIVLASPSVASPKLDVGAMLRGTSGSGDLLLLREHLTSSDMLRKLDARLGLRKHYSDSSLDYFSRLSSPDVPIEIFHKYYLSMIDVELDEYSRVLRINVQAFDPEMAHSITTWMLEEGEMHMNAMGQRLAEEQVHFIEKQVEALARRLIEAREAVLDYQNMHGLISPLASVESRSAIVASLESEVAKKVAQRRALGATRSEKSIEMVQLAAEIESIRKQIADEQKKMAAKNGESLNRLSIEYEALLQRATFALELYTTSLGVLETTRVQAARQLKQVSVLQAPTLPEYSTEPQRFHNIFVFSVLAFLFATVVQLFVLVIRDHQD